MFDVLERQKEEVYNLVYKCFVDFIICFFDKLQIEEIKYNNRMEELQVGLFQQLIRVVWCVKIVGLFCISIFSFVGDWFLIWCCEIKISVIILVNYK